MHHPANGVLGILDRRWRVEGARPGEPPVDELEMIGDRRRRHEG